MIPFEKIIEHIKKLHLTPGTIECGPKGELSRMTATVHVMIKDNTGTHPDIRERRYDSAGICRAKASKTRLRQYDFE